MNFINLLKEYQLKATPQRLSVLKVLYKNEHPTIDELYEDIREEHPSISLATVYKNVSTLKEHGVVIEVNMPNGKMRYDIYTRPHIHAVCVSCGSVEDVDYSADLYEYQTELEQERNWQINRLDVIATINNCDNCR
ncbi:MAG: transcriptional repressor [Campylobacteraceae bacterium]|jgi:Fur family peroxide stress response transcriptional regulator|nr:transcriptional repressor [Campylobacteraceae bacterium]